MKKLTTKEFINKAINVHGDKYDYSKVNYTGSTNKVIIICKEHGQFEQVANAHLRGKGCPKCKNGVRTTKEFIEASIKIHGQFYNYNKTVFTGSKNKVIITCPIHGDFEQKASNHINKHYGCPKCGIEHRASLRKLPIKDFVQKASYIHNNKYDYSKVNYNNMHDKVCIICPEHGEFYQTPQKHILRNQGCPKCNQSKGESEIMRYLNKNGIEFIPQYEIPIECNLSGKGRLDFYLPQLNTAIEYNGIQHYEYTPIFHSGGVIDFLHQQNRDKEVVDYCNLSNIKLIQISYQDNIQEVLDKWRQVI